MDQRAEGAEGGLLLYSCLTLSAFVPPIIQPPTHPSLPQEIIDIFAKDFVFVPIYDAGHWTLAIICNPPSNVHVFPRPPTLLLHLDSLSNMPVHQSSQVFEALRTYLQAEWDASARSSTFEQGIFSVPWQYENMYYQLRPDFQRCDCSSSLQCLL